MSTTDDLQALANLGELLAASAHRNGGVIEVSREQELELRQLYGEPAPMLTGTDDDGLFCALFPLEELAEKGWPYIQRGSGCSEEEARARAEVMAATLRVDRIQHAERKAAIEAALNAQRAAERN
jgi:hypothetical protein